MITTTATTTVPDKVEDLRGLRCAAGLSRVDVAIRAGCSPSYVAQVEAGYRPRSPPVQRIRSVVAAEVGVAAASSADAGRRSEDGRVDS